MDVCVESSKLTFNNLLNYKRSTKTFFYKVHACLYSFVPFGVLLIVNVLLVRAMRQKVRDLAGSSFISKKKQLSITLSVMLMTLLFIVFTLPIAIGSLLVNTLTTTHNGKLVLFSFGCFSFTYHAFNLVAVCRFNKHFCKLCSEALKCGNSAENGKSNKGLISAANISIIK